MRTLLLAVMSCAVGVLIAQTKPREPECPPEETRPTVYWDAVPAPLLIPEHAAYGCLHALATRGPGKECA